MADIVKVVFAVYGAVGHGPFPVEERGHTVYRKFAIYEGRDVKDALQELVDKTPNKVVTINNENMGWDPTLAVGVEKHFAAIVVSNGNRRPYACQEGQTIDFS